MTHITTLIQLILFCSLESAAHLSHQNVYINISDRSQRTMKNAKPLIQVDLNCLANFFLFLPHHSFPPQRMQKLGRESNRGGSRMNPDLFDKLLFFFPPFIPPHLLLFSHFWLSLCRLRKICSRGPAAAAAAVLVRP